MSTKKQIRRQLKGANNAQAEGREQKLDPPCGIELPKDMYLHTPPKPIILPSGKKVVKGCPTEWWWHVGTLISEDGKVFGFEINAAAFYPNGFTEVMLTDIENQIHYRQTLVAPNISEDWAESDASKPWQVNLKNVAMSAPKASEPTQNMKVTAKIIDGTIELATEVAFDLTLSQQGSPLIVWGNGVNPAPPPAPTLWDNNFYFSLTRLRATGTITITNFLIGEEPIKKVHQVTGMTWMDHEWGKFGSTGDSPKWILQDMQLDNGICLSNYSVEEPVLNQPTPGNATVQIKENEKSWLVSTTLTPKKSVIIDKKEYFTEVLVEIKELGISATVTSLMSNQTFIGGVYEGVASVIYSIQIDNEQPINPIQPLPIEEGIGTAWMEQTI